MLEALPPRFSASTNSIANKKVYFKQFARPSRIKKHAFACFNMVRSAGVEPTFPASEADALSIELRARKSGGISFILSKIKPRAKSPHPTRRVLRQASCIYEENRAK